MRLKASFYSPLLARTLQYTLHHRLVKGLRTNARSGSRQALRRLRLRLVRPRFDYTPSNRTMVLLLILGAWLLVIGIGKLLPWASALMLLFAIMVVYFSLVSIRMWRGHAHIPNRPDHLAVRPVAGLKPPSVSILVAAHNEAAVIGRLIQSLAQLDYPHYDVLIMDDRSTDGTAALARQAVDALVLPENGTLPTIRVVERSDTATPGKSAVLNDALAMTQGELLAVFDADALVPADFLSQLVPFFQHPRVGGAQARKWVGNPGVNLLTRCQYYEMAMDTYIQAGRDTIGGAVEFRGNGEVVRREAVLSVGGWNEKSLTDDLDLSTRFHLAGWEIRFDANVPVYEEAITHLPSLFRQRRRWAEGSLVRYLEFAPSLLNADGVSVRAKADLVAYIIEFLFPLWLIIDYAYLGLAVVLGDPHPVHLLMSLMLLPGLGLFFYSLLFIAIRRFERLNWLKSMGWAALTSFYLVVVWVPVSLWVILKLIIYKEPTFDWAKTHHDGLQQFGI